MLIIRNKQDFAAPRSGIDGENLDVLNCGVRGSLIIFAAIAFARKTAASRTRKQGRPGEA